ncbi:MAG TPA: hypothetical protein VL651_08415 [Bacteroidia bacterium]|nr:hypothetical protein [Bacteroidia bacterium]
MALARKFEKALISHFRLEKLANKDLYFIGTQIPKKGEIDLQGEKLMYHFHGGGCTFNYGAIHLQYQSSSERNGGIEFSVWPIHKFLLSSSYDIDEDTIFVLLEEQVRLGNLTRIGNGYYRINLPSRAT